MQINTAIKDHDNLRVKDIGEMSWGEIIKDPNIPNNFKDLILLQLDATGQNPGFIKRARFGLTLDEEIEKKRKEREKTIGTALFFQQQKSDFLVLLKHQQDLISKELDNVNNIINKLSGKKEHGLLVKKLKNYRDDLRDYARDLGLMAAGVAVTTSIQGLGALMRAFGHATTAIYNKRAEIMAGLAIAGRITGGLAFMAGKGLGQVTRLAFYFMP